MAGDAIPLPLPGCCFASCLNRSAAEAALLVAHLPPAVQQRLRTFALCLTRTQNRLHAHLPGPLLGRTLSFFNAA